MRSPAPGPGRDCWHGRIRPARPTRSRKHVWTVGVGFSFGFPVDTRIQRIVDVIPEQCWHPATQTDHGGGNDIREGAWVTEATGMIDLDTWPEGSRLILRKERPTPAHS